MRDMVLPPRHAMLRESEGSPCQEQRDLRAKGPPKWPPAPFKDRAFLGRPRIHGTEVCRVGVGETEDMARGWRRGRMNAEHTLKTEVPKGRTLRARLIQPVTPVQAIGRPPMSST